MEPSICVVTPIYNRKDNLDRFISSFLNVNYSNYKLVIIDDGSTDGSSEIIKSKYPEVEVLVGNGNLWWAGATNLGIKWALKNNYDYVLTYNDDQICDNNFLNELIVLTEKYPNSILSSHIYYMSNKEKLLSGGMILNPRTRELEWVFPEKGTKKNEAYEIDVTAGYSVLIPSDLFRRIGLFKEQWFPQIFMEGEFCVRAKRNGTNILSIPSSIVWNDRSDKDTDPIKSLNPIQRFKWFVKCKKSHLEFRQNYYFWRTFYFNDIDKIIFMPSLVFWVKYLIHVILFSLFAKNIRVKIKNIMYQLSAGMK